MIFEFSHPVKRYLRREKKQTGRPLKWIVEEAVRARMAAEKEKVAA